MLYKFQEYALLAAKTMAANVEQLPAIERY